MEQAEHLKMHDMDDRMWWFRGGHANAATMRGGARMQARARGEAHRCLMPVDAFFRLVMKAQSLRLRVGFGLPFGGSVMAIAVKHG